MIGKGYKRIVNLDILIVVLAKVFRKEGFGSLFDKDVSRIFFELEEARRFYWVNSHCMLNLSLHWFITDKEISFDNWWLSPSKVYPIVDEALGKLGLSRENYDSIVAIWASPKYSSVKKPLGSVYGPGGTVRRYSSFSADCTLAWLFVHEFHHQLDEFFKLSGFPEYPHADFPEKMKGFFGEHFDFNAYILRSWPAEKWLKLSYPHPEIIEVVDSDEDGLPDYDPRLPVDELRFGSNPSSPDTDGDGLSDLEELMAGIYFSSSPVNPDTDGDGVPDGLDEYPLYPVNTEVEKKKWTLIVDEFAIHKYFDLNPVVYAKWNEKSFSLKLLLDNCCETKIYLDCCADGWFHGKDNYEIVVDSEGKLIKAHVLDCTGEKPLWDDSPEYKKPRLISEKDIEVKYSKKNFYSIELKIKRNKKTGLVLHRGKEIGFRLEFVKDNKWVSVFERYSFIKLKLVSAKTSKKYTLAPAKYCYVPPPLIHAETIIEKFSGKHVYIKTFLKNYGSKAENVRAEVFFECPGRRKSKRIKVNELLKGETLCIKSILKVKEKITKLTVGYDISYSGLGKSYKHRYRQNPFIFYFSSS